MDDLVRGLGVAVGADGVVGGGVGVEFGVRIVAGEAREFAFRAKVAAGLGEIDGLVADVPGVAPIGIADAGFRLAVAGAALLIDGGGLEAFGVLDVEAAAFRLDMRLAGAVADFATDAGFVRLDSLLRSHAQGAGGVAGEAAEDLGAGIVEAIGDALVVGVAGGAGERVGAAEPGEAVFEVVSGA